MVLDALGCANNADLEKNSKRQHCARCVYYLSEITTRTSNLKKISYMPPASPSVNFDTTLFTATAMSFRAQNSVPRNGSFTLGMRSKSHGDRSGSMEGGPVLPIPNVPVFALHSVSQHDIAVSGGSFYSSQLPLFFHVEQSNTQSLQKSHMPQRPSTSQGKGFGRICDVVVIQHVAFCW